MFIFTDSQRTVLKKVWRENFIWGELRCAGRIFV